MASKPQKKKTSYAYPESEWGGTKQYTSPYVGWDGAYVRRHGNIPEQTVYSESAYNKMYENLQHEVDKDGYVKPEAMVAHYNDFYKQRQQRYDRSKTKSMPAVNFKRRDYDLTAAKVLPLKSTPEELMPWWYDPSICDVESIDTAKPRWEKEYPDDFSKVNKKSQDKINIVSVPYEEKKIRSMLKDSFSNRELEQYGRNKSTTSIKYLGTGKGGTYYPAREAVEISRDHMTQDVLVHEASHHLRNTDNVRKQKWKDGTAAHIVLGDRNSKCIEESQTTAEEMARSESGVANGYYMKVAVFDNGRWRKPSYTEAIQMAKADRQRFTNQTNQALKGDEAVKAVANYWEGSFISQLRHGTNEMAQNEVARRYGSVENVAVPRVSWEERLKRVADPEYGRAMAEKEAAEREAGKGKPGRKPYPKGRKAKAEARAEEAKKRADKMAKSKGTAISDKYGEDANKAKANAKKAAEKKEASRKAKEQRDANRAKRDQRKYTSSDSRTRPNASKYNNSRKYGW